MNDSMWLDDELGNEMRRISEQLYCAGWITDNEYLLWATIVGDSDVYSEADPDSLEQCKSLNAILDGWMYWSEDSNKPEFITMKEWKKLYRAWKRKKDNFGWLKAYDSQDLRYI